MPGAINRPVPPEEQSMTLRLPWAMWVSIRDLAREHQRSGTAEIRAAISSWIERHEHAKMMAHTYAGKDGEQNG